MINHTFINMCGGACSVCDKEEDNPCSVVINDWGQQCARPRREHGQKDGYTFTVRATISSENGYSSEIVAR